MKISHSAVEEYNQCSMKYKLNRVDRLRPATVPSTFVWGGAIDEGLNELLRTKLVDDPELLPTPNIFFEAKWKQTEINDQLVDLKFSTLIEYSKKDLDLNLFTDWEYDQIKKEYPEEDSRLFALELESMRSSFPWWSYEAMEENAKIAYNFLCWLSLGKKAEYIFKAYEEQVLPQIRAVHTIQEEIILENDEGDSVTGFIDFVAEMDDGKVYIMDNKTTSDFKYYKADSIKSSNQLSLYGFAKDLKLAGYVAILKDIKADGRKKGSLPTVKIRIVKDDINLSHQEQTLHKFNITNKNIKAKVFEKLADPDMCIFYGKKCPFSSYCWENQSMKGLIKKENK